MGLISYHFVIHYNNSHLPIQTYHFYDYLLLKIVWKIEKRLFRIVIWYHKVQIKFTDKTGQEKIVQG